jgi:hypothetical protein
MIITEAPTEAQAQTLTTSVLALYLHGPRPTLEGDTAPTPMRVVTQVEAITGKGLAGDTRYLRATRRDGRENLRQVSLIDEGTLARHAERFGPFAWELVKSQLVLAGDLRLPDRLSWRLIFGGGAEATVLQITIRRDPCGAMDLIALGLREAMLDGEQGALARVVRGGRIMVGQRVTITAE